MKKHSIVIVTGAAKGIGKATATKFQKHGWFVIKLDISYNATSIDKRKSQIEIKADVTDIESLNIAFDHIFTLLSKFECIENLCLFSCAGRALAKEFSSNLDISDHTWFESINLNLNSHYFVFSRFRILLSKISSDKSSILFMSSINAIQSAGLIAYSAAKAGLIGLTKTLATPLGRETGTCINCMLAGTVEPSEKVREEPKNYGILAEASALGVNAQETDIAEGVYSILAKITHMTGQTIIIDGGQSVFFSNYIDLNI